MSFENAVVVAIYLAAFAPVVGLALYEVTHWSTRKERWNTVPPDLVLEQKPYDYWALLGNGEWRFVPGYGEPEPEPEPESKPDLSYVVYMSHEDGSYLELPGD